MRTTPTPPTAELALGIAAGLHGLSRIELRHLIDTGVVRSRVAGGRVLVEMGTLAAVRPRQAVEGRAGR